MSVTQAAVKKLILEYIVGAKIAGAGPSLIAGVGRQVIVKAQPLTSLLGKIKALVGEAQSLRDTILVNPKELVIGKLRSEIADARSKIIGL